MKGNSFHVLEGQDLTKSYGKRRVVDGVSLRVKSGEIVGLLGPNGAGKTTTFYIIIGFVKPDQGKVFLDEEDISPLPISARARKGITYLPQEPSVFRKMTVMENLLAVLEFWPLSKSERFKRAEMVLEEMGLKELKDARASDLSGGERRRVEIARALVLEPYFMLLDEPFSGIDPKAVLELQRILNELKEKGIGILISDHNVRETLKICNRAYIIHEGKLLKEGLPSEIVEDQAVKVVYLGEEFRLK